jgi:hypothetical protein
MTSKWDKMSSTSLKAHLKSIGMTQAGDKGSMIHRCMLYDKVEQNSLTTDDGRNPCVLNITDLKRSASKVGVSPIGTADEILTEYINALVSRGAHTSRQGDSSDPGVLSDLPKAAKTSNPIDIARRIIELDESDDFVGILNLAGGTAITQSSSVSSMRKNFLKLSLSVHPDKLQRQFPQATKAFQALVRAFERLSQPSVLDDAFMDASTGPSTNISGKGNKGPILIARSNEGCFRTRVRCPRCREIWSEGSLDGNPDYFYNFLMTGLKTYTCSTCLCHFGCVTALHNCPFCSQYFEYSPQVK